MKRGFVFILTTAIAAALLFYFFGETKQGFLPLRGQSKVPEYHDPAKPVRIAAGREFIIVLESDPTASATWQLAGDLDKTMIRLVEAKHRSVKTKEGKMKRKSLWTFQGSQPGETTIVFESVHSGEKDVAVMEKKIFSVIFESH